MVSDVGSTKSASSHGMHRGQTQVETMSATDRNENLRRAQSLLLDQLRLQSPQPSQQLIRHVVASGVDEYFVRAIVLHLLDAGRIEFTNGRNLRVTYR